MQNIIILSNNIIFYYKYYKKYLDIKLCNKYLFK